MEKEHDQVVVLMSTYNGERYLREQIDSVLSQTGISVRLIVRDDGSRDNTPSILEEYAKKGLLDYRLGQNLGYAKSFMDLCKTAPCADYYAFADQDDVWMPDKLYKGIQKLKLHSEGPAICITDYQMVDEYLNPIKGRHSAFPVEYERLSKPQLQKSVSILNDVAGFGCTQVWNRALHCIALTSDETSNVPHDYIMGMLGIFCGTFVVLNEKTMLFRQHGKNASGARSGVKRIAQRIKRYAQLLTNSRTLTISKTDEDIYDLYKACLPIEAKEILQKAIEYQASWKNTVALALSDYIMGLPIKMRIKAFLKILARKL